MPNMRVGGLSRARLHGLPAGAVRDCPQRPMSQPATAIDVAIAIATVMTSAITADISVLGFKIEHLHIFMRSRIKYTR